jgi:hypothetical protein
MRLAKDDFRRIWKKINGPHLRASAKSLIFGRISAASLRKMEIGRRLHLPAGGYGAAPLGA